MSALSPIIRIATCVAIGGGSGAIGGVFLGYLYETMGEPTIFVGLAEFEGAVCFGMFGVLLGLFVGVIKSGRLSAVIIGAALGGVFAVYWSFVISVPKEEDLVLVIAAILLMALVGFLTARLLKYLQPAVISGDAKCP